MAPGGVRSDKDDQVRLIKVGIGSGHHILAKGADVSCDRARHAQAGVGVDVAAADEALHQLVRDIIILRQQLPRDKIGRASCRERVCPYVYISVVAVTLKQKIHTEIRRHHSKYITKKYKQQK